MTNLPNHLPLPLAGFIRRLRAAGFAVDAGREFQLRRVLHEQGADYIGRFDELKYALAPYVATNAGEQRRFYRLWDDYVVSLEQQMVVEPEDAPVAGWRRWAKQLRYLLIGVGVLLLALLAWDLLKEGPAPGPSPVRVELLQAADARAGQPLQVQNATLLEAARDSVDFKWDIRDTKTGQNLHHQDSFNLHYTIPDTMTGRSLRIVLWAQKLDSETKLGVDTLTLGVLCSDPPQVPPFGQLPPKVLQGESWTVPKLPETRRTDLRSANLSNAGADIVLRLLINGEVLEDTPEEYVFSEEGQTKVQLLVQRAEDPDNCFVLSPPRNVQVGSNIPVIPTIPLKRDIPRQILQAATWLYLFPILFFAWMYWLHRRKWLEREDDAREKTDEELAEEYPFHDVGPYVIPYQDQTGKISVPADFYRIADQLRVREAGLRKTFDGRATVEATVREGGFPSWRERAVKRRANYLVLLRHTDEFQQQDRLLKRLTDFLLAREAELDIYYHGGDFTWFWNEAHPKGWSPTQMTGRYGEHRLIILGDGHGLVDALHRRESRLEPTKERWLLKWSRRLLLTTEPAVDWSFQEVLLHKDLILYPATTNGILRGVADLNQVEEYQGSSYSRWKAERFRRNPEPSHRYRTWKTVVDHRDYLANDPELFRWLTALSVAPNPDWSLTIAIGRGLGLNVTHDRLLQLSRIPWLAANSPDQDLRLAFLAELSFADEQLARAAALEQLEAVSGEVENTFAESEWTANQAVQTFALAPLETGNQAKIRDLRRMGMLTPDQLAELNQVAERQFPATKGGPGTAGDESYLDELLNPPVKAGQILNDREKELLGLIFACLLMFLPMYLYNKAGHELNSSETKSFWQKLENPTDDAHQALEKNNDAAQDGNFLNRENGHMSWMYNTTEMEESVVTNLNAALELMNGDYALVDTNMTVFRLNRLAHHLNWLAADSVFLSNLLVEEIDSLVVLANEATTPKFSAESVFNLNRLHAEGIYKWLKFREIERSAEDKSGGINHWIDASQIRARIDSLNPEFFADLADSMPVNLEYLLANDPRPTFSFDGKIINGGVVDQRGEPIIGAVVRLGGTNKGTVTDAKGKFALALTQGKGYLEVSWLDATPIEVSLLSPGGNFEPSINLEQIVLNVPDGMLSDSRSTKQIRGRVKSPNGTGLSEVSVTSPLQNINTLTDRNGYYSFTLYDDPASILLVFEIENLRREQNYQLNGGASQDLGEIFIVEPNSSNPGSSPSIMVSGLVKDINGTPINGASVTFTRSATRTRTDVNGKFSLKWDGGIDLFSISHPDFMTQSLSFLESNSRTFEFKEYTLKREDAAQQVIDEEEQTIEGLLSKFQSGKYSKTVITEGTASEANEFINRLTRSLKENSGRNKFLTGEELLSSLRSAYGQRVSIGDGTGHSSDGRFLFLGASVRLPRLAQRIQQVRGESEALIITTSNFEDPAFVDYPDLSGSTANLTNELRGFGFNVRTILDPTKAELKATLAQVIKKNYNSSSQVLIIFNTHRIEGDIILKDSKYRDPATYLGQSELASFHEWMFGLQHMLYIGNTVNSPTVPQVINEQNTTQNNQPAVISLTRSRVTDGKLGIGISYRPTLEVAVATPGTMVFSVCIDSYGQVTTARFNQGKSDKFDSGQVQEVEKNAREWRFDVSPKGQPEQQCGEISFVFEK